MSNYESRSERHRVGMRQGAAVVALGLASVLVGGLLGCARRSGRDRNHMVGLSNNDIDGRLWQRVVLRWRQDQHCAP